MSKDSMTVQEYRELQNLLLKFSKRVFSFEEACEHINVSKSFLYRATSNHSIPFFRPQGKLIYFLREDLENFVLQNRVKSVHEIQEEANNR